MYEDFYGFSQNPFQLTPDDRFFYESAGHQKALSYLEFGIAQGEGFVVITGEVGSGKSSLLNHFLPRIDKKRVLASKIVTTQIDPTDALRLALAGYGIAPKANDKASVLSAFRAFLLKQHKAKRRVLLFVDEAQNLPTDTLEELRMLSNLDADGQPLFQCFLLAQPQFMHVVADPNMEQLRQRIIASFHLGPLDAAETQRYVEHRLRKAGWHGDPRLTPEAFATIHEATDGIPRRINTLAGRVLLLGALDELHEIGKEKVQEVVADLAEEVHGQAAATAPAAPAANTEPALDSAPAIQAMHAELEALLAATEERNALLERIAQALETLAQSFARDGEDAGRSPTLPGLSGDAPTTDTGPTRPTLLRSLMGGGEAGGS